MLGALFVRRRLSSRGDPPRSASMRLYSRLVALLPHRVSAALTPASRLVRPSSVPFPPSGGGKGGGEGAAHMTIGARPAERVDVCIIGAGPAGNAMAIRMAQLGRDVCMIERSVFPRSHIGELLSPGIWPQLDLLGVAGTVAAAGFWPCRTSLVEWEGDVPVRRDFGTSGGPLVDRAAFDALLLNCARTHGVRVMQPAVVRTRTRRDQGWHLEVQCADRICALDVDFLADASGRSAVLRGRKKRAYHRTLALYGYWRGARLPDEPRIEAGLDAWYWGLPLPDGTYNAMVFLDTADFRAQRAPSLSATYHALIARSGARRRRHALSRQRQHRPAQYQNRRGRIGARSAVIQRCAEGDQHRPRGRRVGQHAASLPGAGRCGQALLHGQSQRNLRSASPLGRAPLRRRGGDPPRTVLANPRRRCCRRTGANSTLRRLRHSRSPRRCIVAGCDADARAMHRRRLHCN